MARGRPPLFPIVARNGMDCKECSRCHVVKTLADFSLRKDTKSGRGSRCKACANEVAQERIGHGAPAEREEFAPRACSQCMVTKGVEGFPRNGFCRDGYERRCKACRASAHRYRYGVSPGQFQQMLDDNFGLCSICGKEMETACIDHDHSCCPGTKSCYLQMAAKTMEAVS